MNLNFLYQEEKTISETLSLFNALLTNTKIIRSAQRQSFFNDEPKLYDFSTAYWSWNGSLKKTIDYGGGIDEEINKALLKSLGEAIERYCISKQKKDIWSSSGKLQFQSINLNDFTDFTNKQLLNKNFKQFTRDRNTKFWWTVGYNLQNLKKVFVPSQLVSVPYKFIQEQIIRDPITTGAALSTSLGGSIYRGICEIIERDAFMITYLNKLERKNVDLNKSGLELKKLYQLYSRYNLELYVIDITTDLDIPAMMGLVIDRTNIGPAVSVGLSADVDPIKAAIKSAQEALHPRPWHRRLMAKSDYNHDLNSFEGRAMYWSDSRMIRKINYLLDNEKIILKRNIRKFTMKNKINFIFKKLKKNNFDAYVVDVTEENVKKYGFWVTKTIIPKLQPVYLDEKYRYLGNRRLTEVPKKLGFETLDNFNSIPHPFL